MFHVFANRPNSNVITCKIELKTLCETFLTMFYQLCVILQSCRPANHGLIRRSLCTEH